MIIFVHNNILLCLEGKVVLGCFITEQVMMACVLHKVIILSIEFLNLKKNRGINMYMYINAKEIKYFYGIEQSILMTSVDILYGLLLEM